MKRNNLQVCMSYFSAVFVIASLVMFTNFPGTFVYAADNHQDPPGKKPQPSQEEPPPVFKDASVHDPSVIKVEDTFYVFGSHLAAAKTKDFMQWELVATGADKENPLFEDVTKSLEETFDWAQTDTLWAADVTQLENGKFYMYYNACKGDSPRSALGVAVADNIEGPYKDLGIILKSGMWGETSPDGTIYDAKVHPNTVDPHVFYDEEGVLWMVYGSYSGGIFILEMDPKTGKPLPGQGYGKKLIGGNHSRIEGPYIQYNPETDYYYMYLSFGGLDAHGGYNMRVVRSKNPDGPYYDAEGNAMINVKADPSLPLFDDRSIEPYGVKLMGNYLFERKVGEPGTGIGSGKVSPGHNSVYYDSETDQQFLIFHSRFPQKGEMHEIRVHQMFMNEEGWPVAAPYRYAGESLDKVYRKDLIGDYKYINHGKDISAAIKKDETIRLTKNNKITGAVNGTWKKTGHNKAELFYGGERYTGVFLRQWNPTSKSFVMTFTAQSKKGVSIWGSRMKEKTPEEIVAAVKEDLTLEDTDEVVNDLSLPTEGMRQTQISWETSDPSVITEDGIVTRPEAGEEKASATLTATITNGEVTATKSFSIVVLPRKPVGLTAHFPFDGNLADITGNTGTGSVIGERIDQKGGNITYVNGTAGQAAMFDGSSGVQLPDGLISSGSYSVALWLKPEQFSTYTTTFFGASDRNNWISLLPQGHSGVNGNTMVWAASANGWYDANAGLKIPADKWTHVAFTVDNGDITIYINGDAAFSGSGFPDVFTTSDGIFTLGVNWWDSPYQGLMDEVRVYNGALSQKQVNELAGEE
ncbi:LamG-like jellyroll fold domain-containing protein [Thalassobacillus pellis]|uniref:LamG-like jellyroll fold domain-containing protein n=1 Tax=Thalassobacillus pellis TaxID=748008 RepID=UPI0023BAF0D2|nr:LamG-like jellyroll fold domain-containing protein [Thalassobacillus pellis]MBM7553153.1 arabinan endo-1,5-alpha-L-arabinosidase [Thalassobacillus pellis]